MKDLYWHTQKLVARSIKVPLLNTSCYSHSYLHARKDWWDNSNATWFLGGRGSCWRRSWHATGEGGHTQQRYPAVEVFFAFFRWAQAWFTLSRLVLTYARLTNAKRKRNRRNLADHVSLILSHKHLSTCKDDRYCELGLLFSPQLFKR